MVRDPRFAAGRALIQQGSLEEPDNDDNDNDDNDENGSLTTTTPRGDGRRSAAIELFSTLLEECLAKYGSGNGSSDPDEDKNGTTTTTTTLRSIETAPAFYEYGNALLRAAIASSSSGDVDNDNNNDSDNNDDDDKSRTTSGSIHKARSQAAAAAAEARAAAAGHVEQVEDDDEQKPPATVISSQSSVSLPLLTGKNDMNSEHDKNDENNNEGDEDLLLALEMMENGMYRSLNNVSLDQSGWKSTMALTFVFCLSHLDIIQPTQSWRTIPQWQPLPQQLRRLLHRPCHIWNG